MSDNKLASGEAAASATLRQLIMGFRTTQIIAVAARLELADLLASEPQTAADLAAARCVNSDALGRLLRALGSLGLVYATGDGAYALTTLGQGLRRDVAGSTHALAVLYGEEWLWAAYARLDESVATGQTGFERAHGAPLYTYLEQHREAAAVFHDAMSSFSRQETAAILAAYDFTAVTEIVDVGGGQGTLLAALLAAQPHLRGILFDRPEVIADAVPELAHGRLRGRSKLVGGDFFQAVPAGGDCYLLKSVVHNWDDERCAAILRVCRSAIAPEGRLLVLERVVPAGDAPAEAKLFDINMLVMQGGRERTEQEYAACLAAGGFRLSRVFPTASPLSVIEAQPV
jgi:O-methyltransferase domain/Dimerisation domain